ncbi:hypothetical protein PCE1_003416 [Barthelona sp. PCE]
MSKNGKRPQIFVPLNYRSSKPTFTHNPVFLESFVSANYIASLKPETLETREEVIPDILFDAGLNFSAIHPASFQKDDKIDLHADDSFLCNPDESHELSLSYLQSLQDAAVSKTTEMMVPVASSAPTALSSAFKPIVNKKILTSFDLQSRFIQDQFKTVTDGSFVHPLKPELEVVSVEEVRLHDDWRNFEGFEIAQLNRKLDDLTLVAPVDHIPVFDNERFDHVLLDVDKHEDDKVVIHEGNLRYHGKATVKKHILDDLNMILLKKDGVYELLPEIQSTKYEFVRSNHIITATVNRFIGNPAGEQEEMVAIPSIEEQVNTNVLLEESDEEDE